MDTFFGYRAADGRVCIDFSRPLVADVKVDEAKKILQELTFQKVEPMSMTKARSPVGKAAWRRGALSSEAPRIFDCSSFTKWFYESHGIWLPRRAIDQRDYGLPVTADQAKEGDLIFIQGWHGRYTADPEDDVGHVGLVTNVRSVIHAVNGKRGVVEDPIDSFFGSSHRGLCRYIPDDHDVQTYVIPYTLEIEHERDVWWKILSKL